MSKIILSPYKREEFIVGIQWTNWKGESVSEGGIFHVWSGLLLGDTSESVLVLGLPDNMYDLECLFTSFGWYSSFALENRYRPNVLERWRLDYWGYL